LTDSILEEGVEMVLRQKNHLEARYCLEGEGAVEELGTGTIHEIWPGTHHATNDHDRHLIQARSRLRIGCAFFRALAGEEVRDADGSL
jgi:L-ectoine synthase